MSLLFMGEKSLPASQISIFPSSHEEKKCIRLECWKLRSIFLTQQKERDWAKIHAWESSKAVSAADQKKRTQSLRLTVAKKRLEHLQ